jgi:MatE
MGAQSIERGDAGRSVLAGCKTDAVHDDISSQLPPPAVGLMLSLPSMSQPATSGLSREHDQHPTGRGNGGSSTDYDNITGQTLTNSSPTRKSSIGRTSASRKQGSIGSFYSNNDESSETTALLRNEDASPSLERFRSVSITKDWEEIDREAGTSWRAEFVVLIKYSLPLMLTCVLQYSLSGASVIAVGHLGKTELGAVSLAIMTSNVTGYCAYAGLGTSLDTLCAQAYGSGKPHLVGLQVQRMVYFLWLVTVPVAAVWFNGTQILLWLTPDRECAELAGLFLKVLILGAPGFALFEAGKRFVQAQGLFNANLYVLLFCAPLNAFLNWLFVWVRTAVQPDREIC